MRNLIKSLRHIWLLNLFRRLYLASTYYNFRYGQIIKWGIQSKEDTNFTYHLRADNLRYLAHMIAVVTDIGYSQIMAYIEEAQTDQVLYDTITKSIQESKEKGFVDAEVRFGRRLGWYALARAIKPKVIVETGVDKGLGSALLCTAILKNHKENFEGKYYGTDINPKAGYMLSGIYKEVGEILYGDSIESLKQISEPIDLFINDSDHSADYEYREYKTINSMLSNNSIILGDNAHISDKLERFSRETGRNFIFFKEDPKSHWYPGAGIGISFKQ